MPGRADPIEIPAAARPACVPVGERLYVIGDIHGRLDLFAALVAHIRRDNESRMLARARIVLLGDLIDRGPDSAGVVEACRALAARWAGFVVLKGNHEAMMVDGVRGNFNAFGLWLRHGGDAALRSWGADPAIIAGGASHALVQEARRRIPADTLGWIDALPPSHLAGDYLLVHAGIRPDVPLSGQSPQDMLWIRREFLDSEAEHPFVVVHGHSIDEGGVVSRPNRIGIDTGAYRTGVLTALGLEGDRRWTLATDPADADADSESLGADVAAILCDDESAAPEPARRLWPRAAVAALVLASAALLAAVLVRPSGPPPGVQRTEVPAVADGIRIAMPPAAPAPAPAVDARTVAAAGRRSSPGTGARETPGRASIAPEANGSPAPRSAPPAVRPDGQTPPPDQTEPALAPDRSGKSGTPPAESPSDTPGD